MVKIEKPELVAVCTESGKHAEIALFCIEHGCNCIIEKPLALSIDLILIGFPNMPYFQDYYILGWQH